MSIVNEFGKTAIGLARNPLGIIALFIVLLYAIASLVLLQSLKELQHDERLVLILFIAIFPVLVLIVFGWLVSRHHTKLYAPSDFKSDEAFLGVQSVETQRLKLDKDVEELKVAESQDAQHIDTTKTQSSVIENSINLRNNAVLAEDLAIRRIEADYNIQIQRRLKISYNNSEILVDGFFHTSRSTAKIVEVKLIRQASYKSQYISLRNLIRNFSNGVLKSDFRNLEISLILVLVTDSIDLEDTNSLKLRIEEFIKKEEIPIKILSFDLNELKREFGLIESTT